jgi:hypothetical protein
MRNSTGAPRIRNRTPPAPCPISIATLKH